MENISILYNNIDTFHYCHIGIHEYSTANCEIQYIDSDVSVQAYIQKIVSSYIYRNMSSYLKLLYIQV